MNQSLIKILNFLNQLLAVALILIGGGFGFFSFIGLFGLLIGMLAGAIAAGIVCGLLATLISIESHLRLIAARMPSPPLKS